MYQSPIAVQWSEVGFSLIAGRCPPSVSAIKADSVLIRLADDGCRLLHLRYVTSHFHRCRLTMLVVAGGCARWRGGAPVVVFDQTLRTCSTWNWIRKTFSYHWNFVLYRFLADTELFYYRASAHWRAILIEQICLCLSDCLSVRYVPVFYENGLTYCHSFFHHTVAQSF